MAAQQQLNIVITAGGTREYLDPVRYITNASSGRMGYALAEAAFKAGFAVTLITAPTALTPPKGANVIAVVSAADMARAVKKYYKVCNCLIMSAAVSDYTPIEKSRTKRKKDSKTLTLRLKATEDILAWAGKHKKGQFVVGFALEDRSLKQNAEKKLVSKNADMIIANSPKAIGNAESQVFVKTPGTRWQTIPAGKKEKTAARLIAIIQQQLASRE